MALGPYWNLRVDRHDQVYVMTMQKSPENRINVRFAQEIIRALRDIENELGPGSEGCVITRGCDEKFWCTGLDLDEVESNPYASTDGFFPVCQTFIQITKEHDLTLTAPCDPARLPIPNHSPHHWPHIRRCMPFRTIS